MDAEAGASPSPEEEAHDEVQDEAAENSGGEEGDRKAERLPRASPRDHQFKGKAKWNAVLSRHRKKISRAMDRRKAYEENVELEDRRWVEEAFVAYAKCKAPDPFFPLAMERQGDWDGGGALNAQQISDCLERLGLRGTDAQQAAAVEAAVDTCMDEQCVWEADFYIFTACALPRARSVLRQLQHHRVVGIFWAHVLAFSRENGALTGPECVLALDRFTEGLVMSRGPEDVQKTLARVRKRLARFGPEVGGVAAIDGVGFEDAAQCVRESVQRNACARALELTLGQAEGAVPWTVGETLALDQYFQQRPQSCVAQDGADGEMPLLRGFLAKEAPKLLMHMGLAPLQAEQKSLGTLEKIFLNSCKAVLEGKMVPDISLNGFRAATFAVDTVRSTAIDFARQWLVKELAGPTAADDQAAEPSASAGHVLELLGVIPRTPVEREALEQEMQSVRNATAPLPVATLAELAVRVLQRLLRDRRMAERRLAVALGVEGLLDEIRTAFVEEAQRETSNLAPWPHAPALADGRMVNKKDTRRILSRLGCTINEAAALKLTEVLGSSTLDESGDEIGGAEPPAQAVPWTERMAGRRPSGQQQVGKSGSFSGAPALSPREALIVDDSRRLGSVDFRGTMLLLRLALDATKEPVEDSYPHPSGELRHGEVVRIVLAAMGACGPFVSSLPQKEQEGIVRRALGLGPVPRAGSRAEEPDEKSPLNSLTELVRQAYASALARVGC